MTGKPTRARKPKVWTREQVLALGVRTDVPTAGEILGYTNRDSAYRAVQDGTFPVPVIEVSRRLVVPMQPVLDLLRIDYPDKPAGETSPEVPPATAATSPTMTEAVANERNPERRLSA